MRIVFFGTGSFGIPTLDAIAQSSHELVGVAASLDKPQGRHLTIQLSPVKKWCQATSIPFLEIGKWDSPETLKLLKDQEADIFLVIAYGRILPAKILSLPMVGPFNLHASLLPLYRGAAPIHWALMNGGLETGVTVIRMVEKLDAGDILLQKKVAISSEDTFVSLEERLKTLGAQAVLESLTLLETKKVFFRPQEEDQATAAHKINKKDGLINWHLGSEQIRNKVRALTVWPKAHTFYRHQRILILEASLPSHQKFTKNIPGKILKASSKEGLWVATGDSALEIKKLQAEGRVSLSAAEFLKGFPMDTGSFFA